jgi:beta-galactosidase/beta-glucuronidase
MKTITPLVLLSAWLCASGLAALASAPGTRGVIELSRDWQFQIDATDLGEKEQWYQPAFDRAAWTRVAVPGAWDLYSEALWGYEGIGWYATLVEGRLAENGKLQRLRFGRVNYQTKVWLNGEFLGENANGYLPFELDLTGKLKPGQANRIVMRVDNHPRLTWLPGAKEIEWIQYGGILEPVILETIPRVYISDLSVRSAPNPNGLGAAVTCAVEVTSSELAEEELSVEVAIAGVVEATKTNRFTLRGGARSAQNFSLSLREANLWSPENPALYTVTATLRGSLHADRQEVRLGIRRIETRGRAILINGQRFKARGVNRYDEYGKYGPRPPRELLVADLRQMKQAGVNMVRVHYPQSPEILSLYDELGFVMMEEVPLNWWGNGFSGEGDEVQTEEILTQAMPALERMIRRDKNHPCLIAWSMCNESQTTQAVGIAVMRKLLRRAKELDPTRLATFVVSPEEVKSHRAFEDADLVCVNVYQGSLCGKLATHTSQLDELVTQASAAFLRHQLEAFPDKPLLVTEFGARGVPGTHGDVVYTEDFQAACIQATWKAIESLPETSGGVLWSWADYYHRRNFIQYAAFGPYGVVTVDRHPKAALQALTSMYRGNVGQR